MQRPETPSVICPTNWESLAPALEAELRTIARAHFTGERPEHTLQATALVSEAWLRLAEAGQVKFDSMPHFRAWASQVIRHILVDHARRKRAAKRGGGSRPVRLELLDLGLAAPVDVEVFEDLLESLSREHSRAAQVVEMRFFVGMSVAEAAGHLGVSDRTVRLDWAFARAWLRQRLEESQTA